jgi:hypothetical protein
MIVLSHLVSVAPVLAEEGGSGHYVPGSIATLIDLAPTKPGWVIQPLFLRYEGDVSVSRTIPIAGVIAGGVEAEIDAFTLGGFFTITPKVLGANYSVGAYVPFMRAEVTATITAGMASITRTDKVNGLGDITIIPAMLAWKKGSWQYNALLPVYAPTGRYQTGRLANTGLNYWTVDPTVGVSYNNEQNGFNFAIHTGITINSENDDTNYQSGSVLHVDASVQQLLPFWNGFLGIGINGFVYKQVTDDESSSSLLGDFRGRTVGIGPVLSYLRPVGKSLVVVELKWLPELDTENRLEGDHFWLKAVIQF